MNFFSLSSAEGINKCVGQKWKEASEFQFQVINLAEIVLAYLPRCEIGHNNAIKFESWKSDIFGKHYTWIFDELIW